MTAQADNACGRRIKDLSHVILGLKNIPAAFANARVVERKHAREGAFLDAAQK